MDVDVLSIAQVWSVDLAVPVMVLEIMMYAYLNEVNWNGVMTGHLTKCKSQISCWNGELRFAH